MIDIIDQHRVGRRSRSPFFAPLAKRDHRGQQIEAFFGQPVFDLAPVVGAGCAVEDSALGQAGQPISENIAGDADLRKKFFEMPDAG